MVGPVHVVNWCENNTLLRFLGRRHDSFHFNRQGQASDCMLPLLHHQTKGKIAVEITCLIQLNWAWDACQKEEVKINVPPIWSTSPREGWLPNPSPEQHAAVSELLQGAISGWCVGLRWYSGRGLFPQECLLCPELCEDERSFTWLLRLSTVPGCLLKQGILSWLVLKQEILSWLVKGVRGSFHAGTTQLRGWCQARDPAWQTRLVLLGAEWGLWPILVASFPCS